MQTSENTSCTSLSELAAATTAALPIHSGFIAICKRSSISSSKRWDYKVNERIQTQGNLAEKSSASANARSGLLQCKCACGGIPSVENKCAECHAKGLVGLRRDSGSRSRPAEAPTVVHEVLSSSGQPLDAPTRAFMEPRFGHDFSRVRVHTDARAVESARALNALAYTVGRDVVFGKGQYAPQSNEGRRLLAHELTHVLQQSPAYSKPQLTTRVSHPSDAAEVQADKVAWEITNRSPLPEIVELGGGPQPTPDTGTYKRPWVSVSPTVIHRRGRPWPINGYVINDSSDPVTVWSDEKGLYTIAPGATSGRFTEDVDHIQDKRGLWYKIGPYTVTVDAAGEVSGYQCQVGDFGQDCPSEPEKGDFPPPTGPTRPA